MAVTRAVSDATIAEAAEVVRDGGLVVYPTETCYGLGCDATNPAAVAKVYEAKGRDPSKGLTAVVADLAMAEGYGRLTAEERRVAEAFMPGPLTLVVEKRPSYPDATNRDFAFRVPGSATARELARAAGVPVVATSANVAGGEERYRVEDIDAALLEHVDLVLDAGELDRAEPSTVTSITGERANVHRDGPVTGDEIEAILHGDG